MTAIPARDLDLLVVGAGPTGIAIGAAAREAGLSVLLVERGALCESIRGYPTGMVFFTTRERLEIAGVPFTIANAKPTREQALAYYREVVRHWRVPFLLRHEVTRVERAGDGFVVDVEGPPGERTFAARAVALASGYFGLPRRLGVPGEDLPWVRSRYVEPYEHFGERVLVVGAGNSAAEAALELFRWGARVILAHRGPGLKPGVKYWLKPDVENRLAAGEIEGLFETCVVAFEERDGRRVRLATPRGEEEREIDTAYVQVGYRPELELARRLGVHIDPETLEPRVDPETCESDVAGFYVAGTLLAGRFTDRIFIENSREHAPRLVAHLRRRLGVVASAGDRGAGG